MKVTIIIKTNLVVKAKQNISYESLQSGNVYFLFHIGTKTLKNWWR